MAMRLSLPKLFLHIRLRATPAIVFMIISLFLIGASAGREIAAAVYGMEIEAKDVSYRIGVEKAYGNKNADRAAVVVALVNDALEQKIAAANNAGVSEKDIEAYKSYVDQNSKAPDLLAAVKAVFKGDEKAYERLYLLPRIVNRKLHSVYSRDAEIHRQERLRIEKAYGLAVSGKALKDAASELGLEYLIFSGPGEAKPETPAALAPFATQTEPGLNDPLAPIIEKLTIGRIHDHIVEDEQSYQVIRLLEKNGNTYSVESIRVRKRPFDEWFREEAGKLKITIPDPGLRRDIALKYPEVWWVKKIVAIR